MTARFVGESRFRRAVGEPECELRRARAACGRRREDAEPQRSSARALTLMAHRRCDRAAGGKPGAIDRRLFRRVTWERWRSSGACRGLL